MLLPLIRVMTYVQLGLADTLDRSRDERGQSMVEYGLLIGGVALFVAGLTMFLGKTDLLSKLFSSVIGKLF